MIVAIIIFTLMIYSCCVVAGQEDERMECMEEQYRVR